MRHHQTTDMSLENLITTVKKSKCYGHIIRANNHSIKKKFVPRVILVFMLAVAFYILLCAYNPSLTSSKNKTKNIRETDPLFS